MSQKKKSDFGWKVGDWAGYHYRGANPRGQVKSLHPGTSKKTAWAMIKPDKADNHSNHGEAPEVKHYLAALHHVSGPKKIDSGLMHHASNR